MDIPENYSGNNIDKCRDILVMCPQGHRPSPHCVAPFSTSRYCLGRFLSGGKHVLRRNWVVTYFVLSRSHAQPHRIFRLLNNPSRLGPHRKKINWKVKSICINNESISEALDWHVGMRGRHFGKPSHHDENIRSQFCAEILVDDTTACCCFGVIFGRFWDELIVSAFALT